MFRLINYLRGFLDKYEEVVVPPAPEEILLAIVGKSIAVNFSDWEYRGGLGGLAASYNRYLTNAKEKIELTWHSRYSAFDSGFHSWKINDIPIRDNEGMKLWKLYSDISNEHTRKAEQEKAIKLVQRLLGKELIYHHDH